MKWQPADGKHYDHQRQHLGGLLAPIDAVVPSGRADVVFQLDPDADVSIADDGQREDVLQEQHGEAVDDPVPTGPVGPILGADRDSEVDGRDLLVAILSEDGQGCRQDGGHGPGECHDEKAGVPGEAPAEVEDDAAVTLQGDDGQGQDGHVHAQGLSKRHHVAQHSPELPLIQQSVNQRKG